jgi:hypothetical protein
VLRGPVAVLKSPVARACFLPEMLSIEVSHFRTENRFPLFLKML